MLRIFRICRWLVLGIVFLSSLIWGVVPVAAGDSDGKSGVQPQVINLPPGPGSIQGLGESFQPQLNTGTAGYQVPFTLPPGTGGHTLDLSLVYDSGQGNSPFGLGWRLNLPYIQRQTDKGLPLYLDNDLFVHSSGEELVPLADGSYRFKVESAFTRFQLLGEAWEAIERDGTRWLMGETTNGRVVNTLGTFAWLPQRKIDTNGNETHFFYLHDGGQVYLSEIRYNFPRSSSFGQEPLDGCIRIKIEYESRPDPFADYRSRFLVYTAWRVTALEIRSLDQLIRRYELGYDDSQGISLLNEVRELGTYLVRWEDDPSGGLPPLMLGYTLYDITGTHNISMSNPPLLRVGDPNVDLVDINADSLPDIVYTDPASGHRFYLNRGLGRWDAQPIYPSVSPPDVLETIGVQLADMDGDSRADFLVKAGDTPDASFYYYPNQGGNAWELSSRFDFNFNPPFTFEDDNVTLVDLNNDKRIDVLRTTDSAYYIYFNYANGWSSGPDRVVDPLYYGTAILYNDPRVHLADMNGDGLQDMLLITDEQVVYFPSRGMGDFDAPIIMGHSPSLFGRAADVLSADINGDGLTDLLLVDRYNVSVWLNQNGIGFDVQIVLTDTPEYIVGNTYLRLADVNGDGVTDLLYSTYPAATENIFRYLDFTGGVLPYLLQRIDNNLGRVLMLSYRTSTDYQVDDWDAGQPWTLRSPVPVTVVSQSIVHDTNSGQDYTTNYLYRNAYYDVVEKAFRGFALVEQTDQGDGTAPTQIQRFIFDTGATDLSRKGLILQQDILGTGGTCGVDTPAAAVSAATDSAAKLFDTNTRAHSFQHILLILKMLSVSNCYQRTSNQLQTQTLYLGIDDRFVTFSTISETNTLTYDATSKFRRTQQMFRYDQYGNQIQYFDYGEVADDGTHPELGQDERLITTTYAINTTAWIINRTAEVRLTDLAGNFVSHQRRYYDGPAFTGLPLGQIVQGNLSRQEDNLGPEVGNHWVQSQRYRYDDYGNPTGRMDPNGVIGTNGQPDLSGHWTSITFDPVFHVYPVAEAIQLANASELIITADFDLGFGVVTHAVDFNAQEFFFRYDPLARLTAIIKPGDSLVLPSQVFTYTLGNGVSSITTETREHSGTTDIFRSVSYFDGLGRRLQTRTEGENGQVVVQDGVSFNLRGKEQEKYLAYYASIPTFAYGPPEASQPKTTIIYDPLLREIQTTNPDGTFTRQVHQPFELIVYDEEDTDLDSLHFNTPTTFRYDGLGRQRQTLEHNATEVYATSFGYDLLDNLTIITDTMGYVKRQAFDGLKRKLWMDDPDQGLTLYTYDDTGNVLETVDAKEQHILYSYDSANRLLTENDVTSPGDITVDVRYHYDVDLASEYPNAHNTRGRLAWVEDTSGNEYLDYDSRGNLAGRIKRIVSPAGGGTLDFVILMAYDTMERLVEMAYPDGVTLTYHYNEQALLESIPGYLEKIDYVASGQRSVLVTSDGVQTSYSYDDRQRLINLQSSDRLGLILQDLYYQFDGVSNIVKIDDARVDRTSADDDSRSFVLDDLYRLAQVHYVAGVQDQIDYAYDPLGNLVRQVSTVPVADLGDLSYGQSAGPHALTQVGSDVWHYDANGNLSTKSGYTYMWDFHNRLVSVSNVNGLHQKHTYDYAGTRASKQVSTATDTQTVLYPDQAVEIRGDQFIKYIFAGDQQVAEVRTVFSPGRLIHGFDGTSQSLFGFDSNQDGLITVDEIAMRDGSAVIDIGEINDALELFFTHIEDTHLPLDFATISAALEIYNANAEPATQSGTIFYHPDHLGSSTVLVNEQGSIVERSAYYPYGAERFRDGNSGVNHRFTGKELDSEISLYDYDARFYDPVVGSFISVDPLLANEPTSAVQCPQKLNLYAYALGNPIRYIDPYGTDAQQPDAIGNGPTAYAASLTRLGQQTTSMVSNVLAATPRMLGEANPILGLGLDLGTGMSKFGGSIRGSAFGLSGSYEFSGSGVDWGSRMEIKLGYASNAVLVKNWGNEGNGFGVGGGLTTKGLSLGSLRDSYLGKLINEQLGFQFTIDHGSFASASVMVGNFGIEYSKAGIGLSYEWHKGVSGELGKYIEGGIGAKLLVGFQSTYAQKTAITSSRKSLP